MDNAGDSDSTCKVGVVGSQEQFRFTIDTCPVFVTVVHMEDVVVRFVVFH